MPREAIVASNPFVALHPGRSPAPPRYGGGGPFPEAGPARLTRFLEMSLDNYYATVSEMVSLGQFEHIGHATVRIEGASAWGVWLRVDHWPTALGRHPRLRCGVLYHVANRTLSFHGVADAVQFLLPLFESWTYASLPQLPSVRSNRVLPVPPLDDPRVPDSRVLGGGPSNFPVSPSSETTSLRALVHQLIDLCRGNQREIARLQDEVSQMRTQLASRPHAPPPVPQAPPPVPAPPVLPPRPHLLPWVGTVLFFAATLGVPTQSPRLAQFGSVKHTARALGATYTGLRLARVASVACVVATPLSPGLVPAASAPCIAPACDARFIAGVSQCVPRQIVPLLRAPLALSALVRRIVLTHNVLEVVKILHIILGHLDLHVRTR